MPISATGKLFSYTAENNHSWVDLPISQKELFEKFPKYS